MKSYTRWDLRCALCYSLAAVFSSLGRIKLDRIKQKEKVD